MTPRERHLLKTYGITEQQYEQLLQLQDGRCYICNRAATTFRKRLSVDHNHRTGEIRGILCHFCNTQIIGRHTEALLFEKAASYLSQGTGLFVPVRVKKRRKKRKA